MRFGEDPNVSGTVLISDGVLAGADIPGKENPYAQFESIRPAEVIDRGVYVYRGQFKLGAVAAMEHVAAATEFAKEHNVEATVREARIAVNLDPNNPEAHALLGDALAATGETTAAQSEYAAALHSSELDPAFQKNLLAELQAKTSH
jgi:thioredoxin-like negative regulator of GroEL